MTLIQIFIIVFALLTFLCWHGVTTYYLFPPGQFFPHRDIFGAAHSAHLDRVKRLFMSTWTIPLGLTALSLLLTRWWSWHSIDPAGILNPIIFITSGMITWFAITRDVELATGRGHLGHRALLVLAWVGVWFYPGFLIILIHIGVTWLRSWTHHQHMAIRVMIMFLACLGALPLVRFVDTVMPAPEATFFITPVFFLFLCVNASHYLKPAVSKLTIGRHWHSWMRENRLHSIAISAYLWGWLRFLPEAKVIRLVQRIRPFDVMFQVVTTGIEVSAILMIFDQRLCLAVLIAFTCFHAMVAILSGILFWQNMVVNALLFWGVYSLPAQAASELFGVGNGLLAAALLLLLPFRGRLWRPYSLSWWDTPFSCRVHYEAKGESGRWYGLYSDFMCPNERIFGKTYGDFLVDEKRITRHIGETSYQEVAERLHAVDSDPSKIEAVKHELGTSLYDGDLEAQHDRYLLAFIRNFNAGHKKRVCPLWLKAPGDQLFYWGSRPRFTGQERIDEVRIYYREQYFDGQRVHILTDRIVKAYTPEQLQG